MPTPQRFNLPASLQRYDPALDPVLEDEAQTATEIADVLRQIAATTFADGGHAIRSVHAKSHGLIKATLSVLPDLPPPLAQGMFARSGVHDALLRFSTTPGDLLGDKVSTPRGVAIKVLRVEGERLEGSEASSTQDWLMVNAPRFNAKNGKAFLRSLELVAKTTDRAEGAKRALSAVLRGTEALVEAMGGRSGALRALGGEPPHHVLGETYHAQLPLRHGDHIARYRLVPVSSGLLALSGARVDLGAGDDALRDAVVAHFAEHDGAWELRAQLCSDVARMPIDDPTAEWDEDESPFFAIATLTARPQRAWSAARSTAIDDAMGFSPWNGLAAHRPLGEIMRLRKLAYASSQQFRAQHNRCALREPASLDEIPD